MNKAFLQELIDTNFVHSLLPLHEERAHEARLKSKPALAAKMLWSGKPSDAQPVSAGPGSHEVVETADGPVLRRKAPVRADHFPEGSTPDGYYANFGMAEMKFLLDGENWEGYHRLSFSVKPEIPGARVIHINVMVYNEGKTRVPDLYYREGATTFTLKNHEWNDCVWEFPSMPRDRVTGLNFYVFLSGQDTPMGSEVCYDFRNIRIEAIAEPELEKGWQPAKGQIVCSTAGYWMKGKKTAVANIDCEQFSLLNVETGETVYTAPVKKERNDRGTFTVLDFSGVEAEGSYILSAGGAKTEPFSISHDLMDEAVWKVVNFLYCQRCGAPVANRHGSCHYDMVAEHNGVKLSYAGGWHDAGDVSQQTLQTGEITDALFEMAESYEKNTPLYRRLLEEAQWGLEFLLRTRFGDGYRATSAGAVRWTNGKIGDMDDITVNVHNHAFENFMLAGVEANAAYALREADAEFAWGSLKAAREDFSFARERFAARGMELSHYSEHTYNASLSQYYACITWAAAAICRASGGDEAHAAIAREYARKLLACQDTGEAGIALTGFFYRDETQKSILHFCHQSREQQFMQALKLLCLTQPDCPDRELWEGAMHRYGGYLLGLMTYTAPYGIIPAGVYRLDEPADQATFELLHPFVKYEQEYENYIKQLAAGVSLGNNHVLRCFPVWFSFRGNLAVQLAMGKGASLLARYFGDDKLLEIAREQFYWLWGKNPFGQSLMYGMGHNYPAQYAILPGEAAGELPVGIETYGNEDIPYWPQNNNATYREVWTTPAGRFLWMAADLYG